MSGLPVPMRRQEGRFHTAPECRVFRHFLSGRRTARDAIQRAATQERYLSPRDLRMLNFARKVVNGIEAPALAYTSLQDDS